VPGGRNLSIPGFAPKVTTFRATLYAVLLGLSLRTESPSKQNVSQKLQGWSDSGIPVRLHAMVMCSSYF